MKEHFENEERTLLRVLILEDDPLDADLIQDYLAKAGYHLDCQVVSRRFDFVRTLFTMVPHIIIANYHLGEYSGLEALAFVRRAFPEVPFLVTSSDESPELSQAFLDEGATFFLHKKDLPDLPHYFVQAFGLHPNGQDDLINMKIQSQIRENIEALGEIRAMLGSEGVGELSNSIREEIEQSISYLMRLSSGLRSEAKSEN